MMQPEKLDQDDIRIRRLKRRLDQRDHKIAGLEKRIAELQKVISTQAVTLRKLPIDIERAVQRALCSVRMIPVIGVGGDDKIIK